MERTFERLEESAAPMVPDDKAKAAVRGLVSYGMPRRDGLHIPELFRPRFGPETF